MSKFKNRLFVSFIVFYAILSFAMAYYQFRVDNGHPSVSMPQLEAQQRVRLGPDYYRFGQNWLRKDKWGLWEMYLQGNGYERGLAHGKLTKELMEYQEQAFVDKINQLVPSPSYIRILRTLIAWFNRDMENYIPQEYKNEIYGISQSCNPRFNYIGPAYRRILNYHGAHDIGHALQNLALVGCTSFAMHKQSAKHNLLLGRNFDFYVSDEFAKNVIIAHVNPSKGHQYTYVTWASFIGVASGMNDQGLTVTINAAKSTYPTESAMPISLLAHEILQYASTIDQAVAIAHKRKLFVSESLQIGSAKDNSSAIIEKTPDTMDVYRNDKTYLVCANHFQGEPLGNTKLNKEDMAESPSVYRQERCEQLIGEYPNANYKQAAIILRDMKGINNEDIGYGNEMAMNQLISHHSVIFEPQSGLMWVSTHPYQLGDYLAFKISDFKAFDSLKVLGESLEIDSLRIAASPFLKTTDYVKFILFKKLKAQLQTALFRAKKIPNIDVFASKMIADNPHYYYGYMLLGNYYYNQKQFAKAKKYYSQSLKMEIGHRSSIKFMQNRLNEIAGK